MKIDKSLLFVLSLVAALAVTIVCSPAGAVDPSAINGVPRPTVIPSCGAGKVGFHGNAADDCLYYCYGVNRGKIAGSSCVVPTTTATATPTPTATSTP